MDIEFSSNLLPITFIAINIGMIAVCLYVIKIIVFFKKGYKPKC
jgi:hypothetical protein